MANLQTNPFQTIRQVSSSKHVDQGIDTDGIFFIDGDVNKAFNELETYQRVGNLNYEGYVGNSFTLGESGTSDTKVIYQNNNAFGSGSHGYIESVNLVYSGTATGYAILEFVYYNSVGTLSTQQFKLNLENEGQTDALLNIPFSPLYDISFRVWGKSGGNGKIEVSTKLKIFA